MKQAFTFIISVVLSCFVYSQTIPEDSLYLGQVHPNNTPKIFNIPITNGFVIEERIAISPDGKEIFYAEGTPPTHWLIRHFTYSNDGWSNSSLLFDNYTGPAVSPGGDTLFFHKYYNVTSWLSNVYFSVRNGSDWSIPSLFAGQLSIGWLQMTDAGDYYVIKEDDSKGISKMVINATDTTFYSLGFGKSEYFISRDESFIIFSASNRGGLGNNDLFVSYRKNDASWTNPKNLGSLINTSNWDVSPYATADNQFLFYVRVNPSGGRTLYWARIDNVIESLKLTNFAPYLKNNIPNQIDTIGKQFTYTIPDSIFIDDDGNETLSMFATLSDDSDLPGWLDFDTVTNTFSGIPTEADAYNIRVTATDTAGVSISDVFKLTISGNVGIVKTNTAKLSIFPNPAQDVLNIQFPNTNSSNFKIFNYTGALVKKGSLDGKECKLDISGLSAGEYVIQILNSNELLYTSQFLKRPF